MVRIDTFGMISVKMDFRGFQADSMRETIQHDTGKVERKDLRSECDHTQQRRAGGLR